MSDIQFAGVSRTFQRHGAPYLALKHVDFTIRDKEFIAIVGPSGCGKTTLMRMAAGLESPSTGSVSVAGRVVKGPGPDRAVVFQQFALFPWKTVWDNIGFGLKCKRVPKAKASQTIARYVELMGLQGHEQSYPHQLSGGMQQRVAIARSYAVEPDVLCMDEPFGALDAQTRVVMQEELAKVTRANPRTVIFITHAVEEAVYLADRVLVMSGRPGRVREVVDVATVRREERWDEIERIESVMELESFVKIRARLWRLLREAHE